MNRFMQRSINHIQFSGFILLLGWLALRPVDVQAQAGRRRVISPVPGVSIDGRLCVPDQQCGANAVTFYDSLGGPQSRWTFGDDSTGTGQSIQHSYQRAGIFPVTLTRPATSSAVSLSVTFSVTVGENPQPFQKWRTDTTICKGEIITLDPYGGPNSQYKYLWYPKGDTTQTLAIDSSGCYSIESIDPLTGCSYQDRINVKVCGEQSQQQGAKWYFGNQAGLDFSGGAPRPLTDGALNTIEGSSSIANTKGQLLFYSDGITIYDKDGKPMRSVIPGDTATKPLGGNTRSTQSALIVPKPTCRGCDYLYYVYTTSEIRGTRQLTYSVVDMRENKGNGGIVQRNTPVYPGTLSSERSTSVRNDRDTTFWVITHDFGNNVFRVSHLTPSGTSTTQSFSLGMPQDSVNKAEGYIKVGPADTTGGGVGNRPMAMVIPGPPRNYVEVYTFNDSTGRITGPPRTIDLGPAPPKAYGVEFSPDGKQLYVSLLDTNRNGASQIVKYDLNLTDSTELAQSRVMVDSSTIRRYGALQIGQDGRIYVAVQGSRTLATIDNPNGGLLDSLRFSPTGQFLGGKTSQLGLPNLVTNFNQNSGGPAFMYSDTCAGRPTQFQITPACPPLKEFYTLSYGDGSAPYSGTAAQASHTYRNPGTYFVSLRVQVQSAGNPSVFCLDTLLRDTLTIKAVPLKPALGPDQTVCQPTVTLTANVQAEIYVWVRGGRVVSRQKQFTTRVGGRYVLLAANGECFESDTINVLIRRPPTLDLGPDTTFCQGSSYALTVPQTTWTGFRWSNGDTQKTTSITRPGLYSLTATVNIGGTTCTNNDSIRLQATPKPRLTAVLSGPTTCTGANGSIQLTAIPSGSYSYSWTNGNGGLLPSTTANLTNLRTDLYRVRATAQTGCSADSSFALNSPANPLRATGTSRPALCSRPLSGTASLNVQGGTPTVYLWRDASGSPISGSAVLTNINSGTYSVEVGDANGCTAVVGNIAVGLDSTGFANLGPDRLKCVNDTVVLTPVDGGLVAGVQYTWSTGAASRSISVNASGTFSVVVRNRNNGCVGRDEVRVQLNPRPAVSAGPPADICASRQTVQLVGASPGAGQWSGSGIDSLGRFTPSELLAGTTLTATYSVTVAGCANSAAKAVAIKPVPTVNVVESSTLCAGDVVGIRATGSPGALFTWNNGTVGSELRPSTSGNYIVTAALNGCDARDTTNALVKPLPIYSLTRQTSVCLPDGNTATLRVVSNAGSRYFWTSLNRTDSSVTVNRVGTFPVRITGSNGCIAIDSARVVDECEPRMFVPEAFTPNGDGVNDQLQIFSAYVLDYELRVYNRWGEVVFVSTTPEQKWDGTYRGQVYPAMLYPYVVSYRSSYFPDRPRVSKRGSVLLTQ
jgi:gliding motility-associated-like protein